MFSLPQKLLWLLFLPNRKVNQKLLATTFLLASLFTSSGIVQALDPDLFSLCSKFPLNSKCKGFEAPIPLKKRDGMAASCQYVLGDFRKNAKCKIDFVDDNLVIYQERGRGIEQLNDKKLTVKNIVDRDHLVVYNSQTWHKINRWEITYLSSSENESTNTTNSLIILGNSELSQAIAENIPKLDIDDSQNRLSKSLENNRLKTPQVAQLLETKECVRCDLSDADLANLDLKDANLFGANLNGANLAESNLKNAYLVGADLSEANLANADLGGANLSLAKLNNTSLLSTDLQAVNFQGADLQKANLTDAYLRAPTFLKEANLTEANLTRADLRGANFLQANLTRANLTEANLKDTNVKLKNIPGNYNAEERALDQLIGIPVFALSNSGADFKTNLEQANLEEANFQGAILEEVTIKNANLNNANFANSKLEKTDLEQGKLCNTTMPDGDTQNRDC